MTTIRYIQYPRFISDQYSKSHHKSEILIAFLSLNRITFFVNRIIKFPNSLLSAGPVVQSIYYWYQVNWITLVVRIIFRLIMTVVWSPQADVLRVGLAVLFFCDTEASGSNIVRTTSRNYSNMEMISIILGITTEAL